MRRSGRRSVGALAGLALLVVATVGCGSDDADPTGLRGEHRAAVAAVEAMVAALGEGDVERARDHVCRDRREGWEDREDELLADLARLDEVRGSVVGVDADVVPVGDVVIEGGGPGRIDVGYSLLIEDRRALAPLRAETIVEDGRRVACTVIVAPPASRPDPDALTGLLDAATPLATGADARRLASVPVPPGHVLHDDGPSDAQGPRARDTWSRAVRSDATRSARVTAVVVGSGAEARDLLRRALEEDGPEVLAARSVPHGVAHTIPAAGWTAVQSRDVGPYLAVTSLLVGSGLVGVHVVDPERAAAEGRARALAEEVRAAARGGT